MRLILALACGFLGLAVLQVVHIVTDRASRRLSFLSLVVRRTRRPAQVFVALGGVWLGLTVLLPGPGWDTTQHALGLALIAAAAWLVTAMLFVGEDLALSHYRTDVRDNRLARTVHTQVRLIRRVTAVIIAILAIAAMLLTFPGARTAGTSILASAGLIGIVGALAAQSVLGNMLAGLQIAFGKSVRLGDVVIVENEWGRVEELTLTYVVVQIWDDRRLILPTSYFTTQPFQNWTRDGAALIGAVEFDVDWSVRLDDMRQHLSEALEVLKEQDLWDGRTGVLQVTDAVGGSLRVRALVSAQDAPTLWDLRCAVRESLVTWLREDHAEALPHTRTYISSSDGPLGPMGAGDLRVAPGDGHIKGC